MATPSLEISALMKRVRADVIAATHNKQVPWDHSSLVGDVILAKWPAAYCETVDRWRQGGWRAVEWPQHPLDAARASSVASIVLKLETCPRELGGYRSN
jgi:hypothetical protein